MHSARWIAVIALVLTVVVTAASAHIRLAQSGLGCTPWPACHARAETIQADDERFLVARALHRMAASLVGVLVVTLAVTGWGRFNASERVAAVLAVALVVLLAALGRATPSPAPVVTQGNLLGGFSLVGALAWLAAPRSPSLRLRPSGAVAAALVAIAGQTLLGALLSVRHAVAACPDLVGCAWNLDPALLHPLNATPPMADEDLASAGRQGLHTLHRLGGLAVLACVGIAAGTFHHRGIAAGAVALALVQAGLGIVTALHHAPLGVAVAHNALTAALIAALLWGGLVRGRARSGSPA